MTKRKNVCGAKTRSGKPCQHHAGWGTDHPGTGRCRMHGGATPRGAKSPHFKTGLHERNPDYPRYIDAEELMAYLETFDLTSMERVLGTLSYIIDNMLMKQPSRCKVSVVCPECSKPFDELVDLPFPSAWYLQAVRTLTSAQVALLKTNERIVVERIIGDDALLDALDSLAEVLHDECDAETLQRISERTGLLGRGG